MTVVCSPKQTCLVEETKQINDLLALLNPGQVTSPFKYIINSEYMQQLEQLT